MTDAIITKSRRAFFCVYSSYSAMARSKEIPCKRKCFANYLCVWQKLLATPWKTVIEPSILPQIKAMTRGYNMRPRY